MLSTTVHGRVIELSLMKKSRKNNNVEYLEGQITDRKEVCRIVGFESRVWKEMKVMKDKGESVSIINCDIEKDKNSEEYELVTIKESSVISSPQKIELPKDIVDACTVVCELSNLAEMKDVKVTLGNKVYIKGKVLRLEKIKSKERELKKQECRLSDSSGFSLYHQIAQLLFYHCNNIQQPH